MPSNNALHPVIDPVPPVRALLAQGCRAVTIDVFDTLIWRQTLHPSDAFFLLAEAHGAYHHGLRILMEKLVSQFCRRVLRREPNLQDIYRFYPLPAHHEISVENALCQANPFCLALIECLQKQNIPVAVISDMYLKNAQISQLLEKSGYPKLPVFSSASVNLTKFQDGRLFQYVWQQLGIPFGQIVHVGDNPHADVAMARSLGAQTCHIATPREALSKILAQHLPQVSEASTSLEWGRLAIDLHIALGRGIISNLMFGQTSNLQQPPTPQGIKNWLECQNRVSH